MKRKFDGNKFNGISVVKPSKHKIDRTAYSNKKPETPIPFYYAKKPKTLSIVEVLDLDIRAVFKL